MLIDYHRCVMLLLVVGSFAMKGQNHSFSYNSPACANSGVLVPNVSSNFATGGTFVGSGGIVVNPNTGVITLANALPGVYTVTYTAAFCNCFPNADVTATVQILAAPSMSITGPSSVCLGNSITLNASAGFSTYSWNTGSSASSITHTPLLSVTGYTVTGIASNGCTITATRNVTVVTPPSVSISAISTVCAGYNFTMQAITSATSYTWQGTGLVGSGSVVNASTSVNTTYSLLVSAGGCTNIATHFITVSPLPNVSIIGSPTVCFGSGITLQGTGAATFTWSTGAQSDTIFVQPTQSTVILVNGTDLNGCSAYTSHTITMQPRPNVFILGGNALCTSNALILTASGAGTGATYTWGNGITSPTTQVFSSQDTLITVVGTNIQGCKNTHSMQVTVRPSPTISVNSMSVCRGTVATLEAVAVNEGVSFSWFPGNGNQAIFNPAPIATTIYTVIGTLGPCSMALTSTVSVISTSLPPISFSYSPTYCTGGGPAVPTFTSNFQKGGTFSSNSAPNVNPQTGVVDLTSLPAGYHNIQYSVAAKGCTLGASSASGFFVNQTVKITMQSEYLEILPGQSIRLFNSGGVNSYWWAPSEGLDCPSCQTPLAAPEDTRVYCVSSSQACTEGACVTVEVLCINDGDLSLPNAFTPNNDGKNDRFCIQGWAECSQNFHISVIDRWGNQVFESTNPSFCWDGTSNGTPLPSAVYVYVIHAQFKKEPAIKRSGNITLIR